MRNLDYLKRTLKEWKRWQVMENHYLGVKKALTSCDSMDKQGRIRSWKGQVSIDAMIKEGHNFLALEKCCCYTDWLKATGKQF